MTEQEQKTIREGRKALTSMAFNYIGAHQIKALEAALAGEEAVGVAELLIEQWKRITEMASTYDNQDKPASQIECVLHYFMGSFDAWITEKDMGEACQWTPVTPQQQAFGLIDLGEPEMGYISIPELVNNGFELDLYWNVKHLDVVRREARNRGYN